MAISAASAAPMHVTWRTKRVLRLGRTKASITSRVSPLAMGFLQPRQSARAVGARPTEKRCALVLKADMGLEDRRRDAKQGDAYVSHSSRRMTHVLYSRLDERARLDIGHGEVGGDRIGQCQRMRVAALVFGVLDHDARELLAQLDHLQ